MLWMNECHCIKNDEDESWNSTDKTETVTTNEILMQTGCHKSQNEKGFGNEKES